MSASPPSAGHCLRWATADAGQRSLSSAHSTRLTGPAGRRSTKLRPCCGSISVVVRQITDGVCHRRIEYPRQTRATLSRHHQEGRSGLRR